MRHSKLLSFALCICLLESSQSFAQTPTTPSDAQLASALEKITAQTAQLQQEVKELKAELKEVKQQKQNAAKPVRQVVVIKERAPSATTPVQPVATKALPSGTTIAGPNIVKTASGAPSGYQPGDVLSDSVALNNIGQPILTADQEIAQERSADITYLIGSYVMTSQILNIHSAYDASDLLVNQSTMNEDLRFLQQRQQLQALVGAENLPSQARPVVFLSGKVEPLFTYTHLFGQLAATSINLASVELDTLAEASPWAYGFASLNVLTNTIPNSATIGSGNPLSFSGVFLQRGFITIGNLDKSPFYLSAGQEYVPFGRYSSYMLTNPDTLSEGRTNARAAVLGFSQKGLYLSTYALNGAVDTPTGFAANHVYEWGANAGYGYTSDSGFFTTQFGSGFINNIAEAQGYQLTGLSSTSFPGFAAHPETEILQHPVAGFDAHGQIKLGPFNMVSEYVTATREFSPLDLTYNGHGAQPSALHNELDITINNVLNTTKSVAIFLAYDHSWQSLALNIPRNSYIGGFSTSLWKNTIEAVEFRHDLNYSSSDTGSGICDPNNTGIVTTCATPVLGHNQNLILAQIGAYW